MLPLLWMAMGVGRNNKISCVFFGHTNGVAAVRRAVSYARQTGVKFLTLYAFSSEKLESSRARSERFNDALYAST